jgi:hypothetical protein
LTQILLNAGGLKFVLQKRRQQFHDFTGLPLTADGWTDFTAMYQHPERYLDSRIVFVSSSTGNDGTAVDYTPASEEIGDDPFSVAGGVMPYATLSAAVARLRSGYPDILLLRRGDTWSTGFGFWSKNGRSNTERMIVASYGTSTSLPILEATNPVSLHGGGPAPAVFQHLIFADFVGYNPVKDPEHPSHAGGTTVTGCSVAWDCDGVLFEGIHLNYNGMNLNVSLPKVIRNYCVRRSVIKNHYSTNSHAQGMYICGADNLLLEENCFDHNGWNTEVTGAQKTGFNHNLYIDNGNTNVTFRKNICSRASSHGLQLRCGGIATGNLFSLNAINTLVGGGTEPNEGGITCTYEENVVLGAADISAGTPRGTGVDVANILSGTIARNIFAHLGPLSTDNKICISLAPSSPGSTTPTIGINDLVIADNLVWNWEGRILMLGDSSSEGLEHGKIHNVTLLRNRFAEFSSVWVVQLHENFHQQMLFQEGNKFTTGASTNNWMLIGATYMSLSSFNTIVGNTTSEVFDVGDTIVPTLDDYAVECGLADEEEFFERAGLQTRYNWDARLTPAALRAFMLESIPAEWVGEA